MANLLYSATLEILRTYVTYFSYRKSFHTNLQANGLDTTLIKSSSSYYTFRANSTNLSITPSEAPSISPGSAAGGVYGYIASWLYTGFSYVGINMKFDAIGDVFVFWWKIFMTLILTTFLMSCITQFAQYYQLTIDQKISNNMRAALKAAEGDKNDRSVYY